MTDAPVCYRKPEAWLIPLRVQPRLASWDSAGTPGQVRLEEFLQHAEALVRPALGTFGGPAALRLDVGLAPAVDLLATNDLDNYVFPLATRLGKSCHIEFVSVWCSKHHAEMSHIAIADPVPVEGSSVPGRWLQVTTTASGTSPAFKRQIQDQLAAETELPDGPVSLQLSFVIGSRRSWPNLWKPTIDALGPLLGFADPRRQWHPRDGRIVELGMHCRVDPMLGNDVHIAIAGC
jgi:hypothetical protein